METDIRYIQAIEKLPEEEFFKVMAAQGTREKISCVNWKAYPYAPDVTLYIAFSDNVLALMYKVKEEHILGSVMEDNGPVWEDSCVEAFIKDPVSEGYYNFEINCIGTRLAAHRLSRTDFCLFGQDRLSQMRCLSSLPHEKTDMKEDTEWTLALTIPFRLLGLDAVPEMLRANFYKCGDRCNQPHFLSWSPIDLDNPDFHCPEFFGRINMVQK